MQHLPAAIAQKYAGQLPVPVIAIAGDLGLEIFETADFADTQSGSIRKEGDKYVVYVNQKHAPTRKRFTIAHEIAHFLRHRPYLDTVTEHIDDSRQFVGDGILRRDKVVSLTRNEQALEREANQVAAEILMPADDFRKVWENSTNIEEVAERFFVSTSAATVRAKELYGEFLM